MRTRPLTREGLLERYRPGPTREVELARARQRSDGGLSHARGAKELDGGSARGGVPASKPRTSPEANRELRKAQQARTAARLERLEKRDPALAHEVLRKAEGLALASDIAIRVGFGATFGCTGGGTGTTWWDPCNPGYGQWAPYWYGYGPCSSWWWNHCGYWWPNWGWGWCWSVGWGNFGLGWGSHSSWCYPGYNYYGCSPWWYTSVIYVDDYDPPPQVVVVHEYEPRPEEGAPAAEPAAGEAELGAGANLPPDRRVPGMAQALARVAQQYVSLGDLAFSERRFGDAVTHYAKAIEYSPDDGVLYMLLADALFATGDYHYAAFALRKALELEPRLVDTIVDKHGVYGDPQDFEKQLGWLEAYLKDHFADEDARLVLAANYLFGNKPHQAVDLFESSFSAELRKTQAGKLLFDRAQALALLNPFSK